MFPLSPCRQPSLLHGRHGLFVLACWIGTLAVSTHAQEPETASPETETRFPPFTRTIAEGVLFLNGNYIVPPYQIEATEETVTINGAAYDITHAFGMPGRFGGGPGWGGGGPGTNPWGGGTRGGSRPSGSGERSASRGQQRGPGGPPRSMTRWTARHLAELLTSDSLVILFDQTPLQSFDPVSDRWPIYEALLSESPTREQTERFLARARHDATKERWRKWLDEFTPDERSRALMEATLQERDEVAANNERQIAATRRLDQFAYPLTIAGILFSVIAFGHLLQWMGKGLARDDEQSPGAAKHVVLALGLMLGMSLIDLTWTILAGQAGVMKEVNPLAARFLDSPSELAMFKVLATLVGFGILFVWRQRYQIQQATWWACLFCVLVTFRWVVFDSMLN